MGDEFHAVLKLVTGEEIFALVSVDENDGDPIIMLSNPVIMKMLHSPAGLESIFIMTGFESIMIESPSFSSTETSEKISSPVISFRTA